MKQEVFPSSKRNNPLSKEKKLSKPTLVKELVQRNQFPSVSPHLSSKAIHNKITEPKMDRKGMRMFAISVYAETLLSMMSHLMSTTGRIAPC